MSKIQGIRQSLKVAFQERENLVDGMLVALLAKEPLFILGPPGSAKSLICESLCRAIQGEYFSWLCGKFTTPEELFGSLSVKSLQEDKYRRVSTGKLPSADIAFLDEVFKGSSAILNTLLPIINERVWFNDGRQQIPLQTVFTASNEIPQAEELSALWDRLVLRYVVSEMKDEDSFRALVQNGVDLSQVPSMTLAELALEQQAAAELKLETVTLEKLVEIRRAVKELGLYVSDRKWVQAVRVAKANAHLNGHTKVEIEDLQILENVLWASPEQIPEIRAMVRKLCNPIAEIISRHIDAAQAQMNEFKSGKIQGTAAMELFKKLNGSKKELEALNAKGSRVDITKAIEEINAHLKAVSLAVFG